MKPQINKTSARQDAGGPSLFRAQHGNTNGRARKPGLSEVEIEIVELVDRSTRDLRLVWLQVHRADPPPGLSRDLIIRALAHQLQERSRGGASPALRRRLQSLAGEFEKRGAFFDAGIVPKTGTTLLRQWRGRTHTVLVCEDGFEYDGQCYRSLTVIAERITGTHWSGPRFFGLTKSTGARVGAGTGR